MTPGLSLISVGIHDEKDLSLRALEEARKCDVLYSEMYTTKLDTDSERLGDIIGMPVQELPRSRLEEGSNTLLDKALKTRVGVLVGGDCLSATTHVSLILEAAKRGINTRIIHGSSILTAVAETGLSLYKFGKTVTLPFPERSTADSVLNAIEENKEHGLHTLILFDLDAETGCYLTVKQAIDILIETKNSSPFDRDTLIVGISRLGSDDQVIKAGRAEDIARMRFGDPPHAIIVPSQLHFLEEEALRILCGCPEEVLRQVELKMTLNQLIEKYTKSCLRVLKELRLGDLPRGIRKEEVKDLIEHAERYLGDAVYYTQHKRFTALSSISYSEGILDALKLLGLIEFNW